MQPQRKRKEKKNETVNFEKICDIIYLITFPTMISEVGEFQRD